MSNTVIPTDVQQLEVFLLQPITEIQQAIEDMINDGLNKLFTARLIELVIKKTHKEREQLELRIEGIFPFSPPEQREKMLLENASGEAYNAAVQINNIMSKLPFADEPTEPLVTDEGIALFAKLRESSKAALNLREQLTHKLNAAHTAKKALSLNAEEEAQLYRSIESVYEEQVSKRKWYQHDAVKIISLIFFPVLFPVYIFWKKQRAAENIQLNEHSLTDKIIARKSRQHFKQYVNTLEGHHNTFITTKSIGGEYDAPPSKFITKHKKAANEFFRQNHHQWYWSHKNLKVTDEDIAQVIQSKENDDNLRISLGIR